jgi:hypothetical protein
VGWRRGVYNAVHDVLENLLNMATHTLLDLQCPKYVEGVRGDVDIHLCALAKIGSVFFNRLAFQ